MAAQAYRYLSVHTGREEFDLCGCLGDLQAQLGQQARPKKSADIGVFEH